MAHIFDSIANSFGVLAQLLTTNQFIESWIFWIFSDGFRIPMYAGISDYGISINVLVMVCIFLINSCFGFRYWIKKFLYQKQVNVMDIV